MLSKVFPNRAVLIGIMGTVMLLVMFASASAMSSPTIDTQPEIASSEVFFHVGPQSVDARTTAADTIALVEVKEVGAPRWNTPDGTAPASVQASTLEAQQQGGTFPFIYRPVTLRVVQFLKNPQAETELTVTELGGTVNGFTLHNHQSIDFTPGMQAVIFLKHAPGSSLSRWSISSVYEITGGTASSKWEGRSLPVSELLTAIAAATK